MNAHQSGPLNISAAIEVIGTVRNRRYYELLPPTRVASIRVEQHGTGDDAMYAVIFVAEDGTEQGAYLSRHSWQRWSDLGDLVVSRMDAETAGDR